MQEHLDDDENVKAMRQTAKEIGLTKLIENACEANNRGAAKELLRKALRLLGERS
jgi:hypothetical protein